MVLRRNIPVLDIHAVDHCNYHCVGCNHASPRIPYMVHDASAYIPLMEKLAEFTHIDCICIVGGEPTLHPNLANFLAALPWQCLADHMRLYTNGHWLLEKPYSDTIIAALSQVPELCISLHPELVCKLTPTQMIAALIEIRQLVPTLHINLAPTMTFKLPAFSHVSEPRTDCGAKVCLQLEPTGYLSRCPLIRFAAHFVNVTAEFLQAAAQADTQFYIPAGIPEDFSAWYDALPGACSYCRYGAFYTPHTDACWSVSDIQLIMQTLVVDLDAITRPDLASL